VLGNADCDDLDAEQTGHVPRSPSMSARVQTEHVHPGPTIPEQIKQITPEIPTHRSFGSQAQLRVRARYSSQTAQPAAVERRLQIYRVVEG